MKRIKLLLCLALCFVVLVGTCPVLAESVTDDQGDETVECDNGDTEEEIDLSFNLSLDYFCKYVWRGMVLTEDPVFQSSFAVQSNGLTAQVWGNMDLTDVNGTEYDYSELDYLLSYDIDLSDNPIKLPFYEINRFTVGGVHYEFPNTDFDSTTEVFWEMQLNGLLDPTLTMYHDVDEADGTYAVVGFGKTFDKFASDKMALSLGLDLGMGSSHFNKYYWGVHSSKITDLNITLAMPFEDNGWTVTPVIAYSRLLSNTIQATKEYSQDDDCWYAGVSCSLEF